MPKAPKFVIDLNRPLPEWGVSQSISTAVPIVVSGAQVNSTRDASEAMHTVLRARIKAKNSNDVAAIRKFVAKAKKAGSTKVQFKAKRSSTRLGILARKAR